MPLDALGDIPPDALILLIGPSGAGKSTWAAARFGPSEVLESDAFRVMVAGDATDQAATSEAFRVLHALVRARLRRGLRTVVDATNVTSDARRSLRAIAGRAARPTVAIVFDTTLERCLANNEARADRRVPTPVIRRQFAQLQAGRGALGSEGYVRIVTLDEGGDARA